MKRIKKLVVLFWAMMCIIGFIPMKDVQASGEIKISDLQFQENGKVLGYGDILHFSCIINSLNPITSCEVEFGVCDIEFSLKYNPNTKRYEGQSEPLSRELEQDTYELWSIYARDEYGHSAYLDWSDFIDDYDDGYEFLLNDYCAQGLHDSYWKNNASATCVNDGKKQLICKICHTVLQEVIIPATGHTLDEWKVTEKATCTSVGTKIQKCTVCKKTINTDTIPATGHKLGEWIITKDPTCTKSGTQIQKCKVCKKTINTKSIPATGHTLGEWIIYKATALDNGYKTRYCQEDDCDYYEEKVYPKLKPTIKLSSKNVTINVGKSKTIKVSGLANEDDVESWKTSDKKIAVVDEDGKITARKVGKATITVTLISGKKENIKVTVPVVKTTKISGLKKNVSIEKGKTLQLSPKIAPSNSTQGITYTSSNKKIASVSSKGLITAKKAGTAKIVVQSGSKKVKINVIVKNPDPYINYNSAQVYKGTKFTLKINYAPKKVTWSSSNNKVATVNSNGKVTAKEVGKCTITASCGDKKFTCPVEVIRQNPNFVAYLTSYNTRENYFNVSITNRSDKPLIIYSDDAYSMEVHYKSYDRKLKLTGGKKSITISPKEYKNVKFKIIGSTTWPLYEDHTVRFYFSFDGKKYLGSVWDSDSSYQDGKKWYTTYWTNND